MITLLCILKFMDFIHDHYKKKNNSGLRRRLEEAGVNRVFVHRTS